MDQINEVDESRMEEEKHLVDVYPWIKDVPPKLIPLLNSMIGNLTNLSYLGLHGSLEGKLPPSLGNLPKLRKLRIENTLDIAINNNSF